MGALKINKTGCLIPRTSLASISFGDDWRNKKWLNFAGRAAHVMTFEVGAALEDERWQAPVYCFEEEKKGKENTMPISIMSKQFEERLMQMRALRDFA